MRMFYRINLLLILVFSFTTSCYSQEIVKSNRIGSNEREELPISKIRISAKEIQEEFEFTSEMSENFYYVPLETTESSIIGKIDRVLRHEDRIFVLDRERARRVFCFDSKGKFLYRVGKLGKGPGEYSNLEDIVIDPFSNQIGILGDDKIVWYTISDGAYTGLDTKFEKFLVDRVSMFDSTTLIGYANNQCFSKKYCSNFYRFNKEGDVIDQYLPIQANEKNLYIEYENPFSGGVFSSSFTHLLNDSIYVINDRNEMVPRYVVDYSDMALKDRSSLPKNSRKYDDWMKKSITEGFVIGFEFFYENDEIIHFKFRKAKSLIWNLYSKKNGKLVSAEFSNGAQVLISHLIVGVYDNHFISVTPERLLLILQEHLENSEEGEVSKFEKVFGEELIQHIKTIDGISNPVLTFFKLTIE